MKNNDLFSVLFVINCILPVAVMVVYVVVHNKILNALSKQLFWGVVSVLFLATAVISIGNVYISFGGFGPGTLYFCGSFLAAPATAFLFFTKNPLRKEAGELSNNSQKYLISLRLAFILLQLIPFPTSMFFVRTCNSYHDKQVIPLIYAIENYYEDNSEYPGELEILIPKYISAMPEPFCLEPYRWFFDTENTNIKLNYYMLDCIDKKVLAVQDTSLGWLRRYDFENGKWSASDAFDGYCSYLD